MEQKIIFAGFHGRSFGWSPVIIAKQMQQAMTGQPQHFAGDRCPQLPCLTSRGWYRDIYLTEYVIAVLFAAQIERQDIGDLVAVSETGVERTYVLIGGEYEINLFMSTPMSFGGGYGFCQQSQPLTGNS